MEIMKRLPHEENGKEKTRVEHTPSHQPAPTRADTPASALRCLLPLLTPPQSEAVKAQERAAAALRASIAQLEEEKARLVGQAAQAAGDERAGPSSGAVAPLNSRQAMRMLTRLADEARAAKTQAEKRVAEKLRELETLLAPFANPQVRAQG